MDPSKSYVRTVQQQLQSLPSGEGSAFILHKYGGANLDTNGHALLSVKVGDLNNGNPNVLLFGGVHGCEPSGVRAIVSFLTSEVSKLTSDFNFLAYPCISPWSFEYNQRWSRKAEDPNRGFLMDEQRAVPECLAVMRDVNSHVVDFKRAGRTGKLFALALDLHEILRRDVALRRLRASRFGQKLADDHRVIPEGFYLTLTKGSADAAFGRAVIDRVREVSPIASGKVVVGYQNFGGVIYPPAVEGLSRFFLGSVAEQVAVTEVYPDHPRVGADRAKQAQLAALYGALDYVRSA